MTAAPQTMRDRLAGWIGQPVMIELGGGEPLTLRGTLASVWEDGFEVTTAEGPALAPWSAVRAAVAGARWHL